MSHKFQDEDSSSQDDNIGAVEERLSLPTWIAIDLGAFRDWIFGG